MTHTRAFAKATFVLLSLTYSGYTAGAGTPDRARPNPVQLDLPRAWQFKGSPSASIAIVEFNDYQCPFCKGFREKTAPEIEDKFVSTGKVRFYSRSLPLDFHPGAMPAAKAALCARDQNAFWKMDSLLIESRKLRNEDLIKLAERAALDIDRYKACFDSGTHDAELKSDITLAESLGITGTPGFVIGRIVNEKLVGLVVSGAWPFSDFDDLITKIISYKPYASMAEDDRTIYNTTKALKDSPRDAQLLLERARALRIKGDTRNALRDINHVIESNKLLSEAYVERGLTYARANRNKAAIKDYSQAISLDQNSLEAFHQRSIAYFIDGKTDDAVADAKQAKSLAHKDARPFFVLGVLYKTRKQYREAKEELDMAVRLGEYNNTSYLLERARVYEELGELDKAEADYRSITYIQKDHTLGYLNHARILTKQEKWEEAAKDLKRVSELNPISYNFLELGIAYKRAGMLELAIDALSSAIARDGGKHAQALMHRCLARAQSGALELAFDDCDTSAKRAPNVKEALASRGLVRMALGHSNKARVDFEGALRMDSKYPLALFGRGAARRRLSDHYGGVDDQTRAKALDPAVEDLYSSFLVTSWSTGAP